MDTRQRFHAIMNGEKADYLPLVEWATWWDKTIKRWHGEGLPESITDTYEILKYFDMDVYYQSWCRATLDGAPDEKSHGEGIVKNTKDYDEIRGFLFPDDTLCFLDKKEYERRAEEQNNGDAVIWITLEGFFWFPRTLFGIENHLYSFYDEPELMHRINRENAEWMIRTIDEICKIATPDFMTFAEDMSYNNGPMISKDLFDEFMKPYYNMVIPHLKEKGIRVFVDSDGDIHEPAKWFSEAGIEGILPMEAQAGCDMKKLRIENPEQLYIGGFDKMTMARGEDAMRKEFERLIPVAKQGKYIISCDHQTPPGVSLENYKLYLQLFREYGRIY